MQQEFLLPVGRESPTAEFINHWHLTARQWSRIMKIAVHCCLATTALFFWLSVSAQAQIVCPDPPNRVTVTVNATVTFDSATNLYTYAYEVFSDPTSAQDVDAFAVDVAGLISAIASPQGWSGRQLRTRSTIDWHVFEPVPLAPGEVDTGDVPPPLFPITPGTLMTGFSFKSPNPPGPVKFYVTAYIRIPTVSTEEEADEFYFTCPQLAASIFNLAVTGTTEGPVQDSELINISTRAQVGTGDDVMIGGFVVGGTTPKTVLIRARGPSMGGAPFFVPGTLANPFMRLFSGPTPIAENDNWQDTQAAQITATGLDPCQRNPGQTTPPPFCNLESAILITLPPGAYTAIQSGFGGVTGIGLVEAFEVN